MPYLVDAFGILSQTRYLTDTKSAITAFKQIIARRSPSFMGAPWVWNLT